MTGWRWNLALLPCALALCALTLLSAAGFAPRPSTATVGAADHVLFAAPRLVSVEAKPAMAPSHETEPPAFGEVDALVASIEKKLKRRGR